MPELRKDPIIGRWVIIATDRAKRPDDFAAKPEETKEKDCPFCEGKEHRTPPEIYAVREEEGTRDKPGWSVRVIPSISPILQIEGDMGRRGKGIYDLMNGIGAHEIIVDTPRHTANISALDAAQIAQVFDTYAGRMEDLEQDQRLKYVLIYKNYGEAAGGSALRHSCTQLIALPVNPKRVKEELAGARRYYEYRERCIFCDMIRQEIAADTRIIERGGGFVAFAPFASRFPFEVWVLPEEHAADFYVLENTAALAEIMRSVMRKLARALNDPPYNYILHSAPFRRVTSSGHWKTVEHDYHWHIEIMPRLTKVAGFEWGSGFYINPTPPEEAAKYLRQVRVED